jgi:tetratricopeptide (TPR) repeat protein
MNRVGRAAAVIGAAVALVLAGGMGVFTAVRPEAPSGASSTPDASSAVLDPATGGGTLGALIADLERRVAAVPEDWRAYASLGLAYVQQARIAADPGLYPPAEAALERSLHLNPDGNVEALIGMGTLALARHEFAEALDWGEEASRANPNMAAVYGVIGDALVELGRYPEAFDALQRMIDRRPDLSSYARASYALELQGDVERAIELMDLALGAAGSPADTAWALHRLGELHFNSGRLDRAEESYRRALAAVSTFAPAEAGLAKVAAARGRIDSAAAGYEAVVAVYPLPEYVMALADLYIAAGRREDAARQFELLEAEEALLRANGVNVDLEFALFGADHGLDLVGGLAAAEAEWARRKSVQVADVLAWQLHANGETDRALAMSNEALRLGTRNALFHFHRGMIERALGNEGAAAEHLGLALEINPNFSILWGAEAAEALEALGKRS